MLNKFELFLTRQISQSKSEKLKRSEQQNLLIAKDLVKMRAQCNGLLTMENNGLLTEASFAVYEHLSLLLKLRDPDAYLHSVRVARIAGLLAMESGMSDEYCMSLELITSLHDIGIAALPTGTPTHAESILERDELETFKTHCVLGETILLSGDHLLDMAARLARSHHELFDGSGYPDGLTGLLIPLESRIVAVADYIEGLLGGSHHIEPLNYETVYARLHQLSGSYFDPDIVRKVDRISERICHICQQSG
ncbi:MAG: HD domain-containing phosphohydrolase [Nitrosomonadales bacterium]|jgi:putative two-component system response regulator